MITEITRKNSLEKQVWDSQINQWTNEFMFVFRQAAGVIVLLLSRMQGLHFPPAASRIILHANI